MTTHRSIHGPLRVYPSNPRYFTDDTGRAVYLTGSHTWANFQDVQAEQDPFFDYATYIDFLADHNHNFIRLWVWEQEQHAPWTRTPIRFSPLPYEKVGDQYDLDRWNDNYFARLRQRVEQAGERGIYVSVMLFQGWSLNRTDTPGGDPWPFHPFHPEKNINGVSVQAGGKIDDDDSPTLHSLGNPQVLARQEAYVRKVIDTVNDLDNVLYEIINEGGAIDWQIHMVNVVHEYERTKPKQHPVGMTHRIGPVMFNEDLFTSPADWVSPAPEPIEWQCPGSTFLQDYMYNPPASDGRKVVIPDTDHLWGHGGSYQWAWKSFTRGLNPIFMDPWRNLAGTLDRDRTKWMWLAGGITSDWADYPDWEPLREAMGQTRAFAERVNLASMMPRGDLSSSGYCLAGIGKEYIVYVPNGGTFTLDLREAKGEFHIEWFIPLLNRTILGREPLNGGYYQVLQVPFQGDAVLYLHQ